MECYLRALFSQLKVDVPSAKSVSQNEEEKDCDQVSTDAILKELGLSGDYFVLRDISRAISRWLSRFFMS
jgi:hypothetical protein